MIFSIFPLSVYALLFILCEKEFCVQTKKHKCNVNVQCYTSVTWITVLNKLLYHDVRKRKKQLIAVKIKLFSLKDESEKKKHFFIKMKVNNFENFTR